VLVTTVVGFSVLYTTVVGCSVLNTTVVGCQTNVVRFSLPVSKVINLTTNFIPRDKAEIHAINAEKMMSLIMKNYIINIILKLIY
jgi:hypothetical protein